MARRLKGAGRKKPGFEMKTADRIESALREAFVIHSLTVRDVSEAHRGHAGYREGGQSHFEVSIRSEDFKGLSRIARHRAIHAALGAELISDIHALALDVSD